MARETHSVKPDYHDDEDLGFRMAMIIIIEMTIIKVDDNVDDGDV